jgi:anaerobic selenocysteine-containing dehydrogenase
MEVAGYLEHLPNKPPPALFYLSRSLERLRFLNVDPRHKKFIFRSTQPPGYPLWFILLTGHQPDQYHSKTKTDSHENRKAKSRVHFVIAYPARRL